jgi:hypothetical protein
VREGNAATREALTFGRYVLGRDVNADAVALYERAVGLCSGGWEGSDDAVVRFVLESPWALGPIDGALSLARPRSVLRKKLLLMAAILETIPEYSGDFLPAERPWWHAIDVVASLACAACAAVLGFVLLKSIR